MINMVTEVLISANTLYHHKTLTNTFLLPLLILCSFLSKNSMFNGSSFVGWTRSSLIKASYLWPWLSGTAVCVCVCVCRCVCVGVCVYVLVAQLSPILCDPMDCNPPGSSVHGILQATILEWVAVPFFRLSSGYIHQNQVSCIAGRFFTIWATREAVSH